MAGDDANRSTPFNRLSGLYRGGLNRAALARTPDAPSGPSGGGRRGAGPPPEDDEDEAPPAQRPRRWLRLPNPRPALLRVHRAIGLATALFLVLAGLTGSVLVFGEELDAWLNPDAYTATARGVPMAPDDLAAWVEVRDKHAQVWYMTLERKPGRAAVVRTAPRTDPETGQPFSLSADWYAVDPVSGRILADRLWGECCFGRRALVPFLTEFHRRLSLPWVGGLVMGAVALAWLANCFVGLALSLPSRRTRLRLAAWVRALAAGGRRPAFPNLHWHRALGLGLWAGFVLVAVSAVGLSLRHEVFEPVVALVAPLTPTPVSGPPLAEPRRRTLSFDTILENGLDEAMQRRWKSAASEIFYSPAHGVFGLGFGDDEDEAATVWLFYDGITGQLVGERRPAAETAGDALVRLQRPIHNGRAGGLGGRILMALMGLALAALSVTGVMLWWWKRGRAKRKAARRAALATSWAEQEAADREDEARRRQRRAAAR